MESAPRVNINHVGVTVPDIWAAIDCYTTVLGFWHIMVPSVPRR